MGADDEKPWNPDDEIDPAKIQKEYLEVAKDMVAEMKEAKANKKAAEEALAAGPSIAAIGMAYRPPSFSEVSAKLKRCWEETKKIAPDASDFCRCEILRALIHAPTDEELAAGGPF